MARNGILITMNNKSKPFVKSNLANVSRTLKLCIILNPALKLMVISLRKISKMSVNLFVQKYIKTATRKV